MPKTEAKNLKGPDIVRPKSTVTKQRSIAEKFGLLPGAFYYVHYPLLCLVFKSFSVHFFFISNLDFEPIFHNTIQYFRQGIAYILWKL